MGNGSSKPPGFNRLYWALPPLENHGLKSEGLLDSNTKVWVDNADRDQFIFAVVAVASQNGAINFSEHDCGLLYSRRQKTQSANNKQYKTNEEEMVATVVFLRNGIMEAKIESALGGKNQKSAFLAFRKDVEVRLNKLLQSVPGGDQVGQTVGERNSSNNETFGTLTISTKAPPAYEAGQSTDSFKESRKN